MKATYSCHLWSTLICITIILGSCTDHKQSKSTYQKRGAINLFPEEPIQENGKIIRPMTYKEAVTKSVITIRTSKIILVDKSSGRGNKPLYLYKVLSGKAIKSAKGYKKKYPVYFIAYKNLFVTKTANDIVVIFLENIQHNKMLTKRRNIKYQWMNDAPPITLSSSTTNKVALKNKHPLVQSTSTPATSASTDQRRGKDGYLTWQPTNDWSKNRHGQSLTINRSKI